MQLSFDNYKKWFDVQTPKIKSVLAENDLSPENVTAAYEAKANDPRSTDGSLRKLKSAIEYQAFYFSSPADVQRSLRANGIQGSATLGKGNGAQAVSKLHIPGDDYVVLDNYGECDAGESHSSRVESFDLSEIEDERVAEIIDLFDLDLEKATKIREWMDKKREAETREVLMDRLKTLIAIILQEANLRIAAGGLAFAANLASVNGLRNQRFFAAKIGCTPAAISKSVRYWKEMLSLPTNPHMKSDAAIESYRQAQTASHWRKAKCGNTTAQ
jgi:hypothetical protein